ncbi:Annexin D5, partial [Mucuna pruriens]
MHFIAIALIYYIYGLLPLKLVERTQKLRRLAMSTLSVPPVIPLPREDAVKLHKAFKGLGCDTSKVIKILAHRNVEQRSLIQQEYENNYSELLSKRISKELRGHVKKAMVLWLHDPATRDAKVARKALTTPVVDNQAITEVICSRTPSQIRKLKDVYQSTYYTPLEKDIESHTSGHYKKVLDPSPTPAILLLGFWILLLAYINTPRYEGPELDPIMVEQDAKQLYKSGEKRLGTDEKMFIKIFSEQSSAHLAAVNYAYINQYGHSLEKAIKKETSGSFESGLLTILRCASDPAMYFAKFLHAHKIIMCTVDILQILRKSMKGVGTDDSRLTRVIVTRTEIDMYYIKIAYYKKYGKPLTHAVRSDTSGHYKDFLLNLIGSDY